MIDEGTSIQCMKCGATVMGLSAMKEHLKEHRESVSENGGREQQ